MQSKDHCPQTTVKCVACGIKTKALDRCVYDNTSALDGVVV